MTQLNRLTKILLLQGTLLLAASAANADFYCYEGTDGVMVYTNIPTSDDAVRILREQEDRAAKEAARQRKLQAKSEAQRPLQPAQEKAPLQNEAQFTPQDPVLPVYGIVTSGVGWRQDPIDGRTRHHNGVDIAVPTGTYVKAIAAGTVTQSGWHGGYGNLVTIDHGNGMTSMYGHNSQLGVRAGDHVEAGQVIALSGSTGRSTGPHLHFELWDNGANVTQSYLGMAPALPAVAKAARDVKRLVKSDGSVVYTNY